MSALTDRLRATELQSWSLDREAADRIEALEAEVERLAALNARFAQRDLTQIERMFVLEQDVERLTTDRTGLRAACNRLESRIQEDTALLRQALEALTRGLVYGNGHPLVLRLRERLGETP